MNEINKTQLKESKLSYAQSLKNYDTIREAIVNPVVLSIQDMVNMTTYQRRALERSMDARNCFDPAPIKLGGFEVNSIFDGLTLSSQMAVKQSMQRIPLREFLAKSGPTGMQGAAYLLPDKIHQDIIFWSQQEDHVPLISAKMINVVGGGTLTMPVGRTLSMTPYRYSTGGSIATAHINMDTQITLDTVPMAMNMDIGKDLFDDLKFDLIEWLIQHAAKAFGRIAMDDAMTVMNTSTDGYGTLNLEAAAADETEPIDVYTAIDANSHSRHISNTYIVTPESWTHSLAYAAAAQEGLGIHVQFPPIAPGFHAKFDMLDVLFSTSPSLHDPADMNDAAFTACKSYVFDRGCALITARKRWARIENYSNPVADLVGAVIVGEQDSATAYNDAICKITEA